MVFVPHFELCRVGEIQPSVLIDIESSVPYTSDYKNSPKNTAPSGAKNLNIGNSALAAIVQA